MKFIIIEKGDCVVARFSGSISQNIPFFIGNIVNTEFDGRQPKVIFDADSLDENSSTITQLAIMTALKKEMDLMNGSLKICSLRPRIKDYLFKNRLNRIFDIYEDLNSAETSPWKRKGYEEKQWNRGTAA